MTESSITERGAPELADTRRRIWAIVGASSGNLVEWFDFYVYSFCSLYFAHIFFPSGNTTTQLLQTAGVFAAGFLMRPIGGCYQRCKTDPPQRLKIDPGVNLLL